MTGRLNHSNVETLFCNATLFKKINYGSFDDFLNSNSIFRLIHKIILIIIVIIITMIIFNIIIIIFIIIIINILLI